MEWDFGLAREFWLAAPQLQTRRPRIQRSAMLSRRWDLQLMRHQRGRMHHDHPPTGDTLESGKAGRSEYLVREKFEVLKT